MSSWSGELVVLSGPYKGRRVPVAKEKIRIGRDTTCDIALEDEAVSRLHAEVLNKNHLVSVKDNGSTNGTFINDSKVEGEKDLKNGDRLAIGDTVFLVELYPRSNHHAPQVVFSEERKDDGDITTKITLNLDETRFLEMKEGITTTDAQRYFTCLYEFIGTVSVVLQRTALLERALDYFIKVFHAERGVAMLVTPDGEPGEKLVRTKEGLPIKQDISIPRRLAQQLLQNKESILSSDPESAQRLASDSSAQLLSPVSLMGVPLKLKDRVLGLIYLDKVTPQSPPFTEMDLKIFSAMSVQCAISLENTALYSELLDAAEFNNSILRALSSGMIVTDISGRIIRSNRAAWDILRKDETELTNKILTKIADISDLGQVVEKTLVTGQPEDRYEVHIKVGAEKIPLGLSTSLLTDHTGKTVGVVANFRNMAPIRKLEEQVRRSMHLAALGQMAAGVAHEIRNPLNSIRGFTQLINESSAKDPSVNPTYKEYSQIVLEEVDRMNRIVQDLLDFSRQRELTLSPMNVDLMLASLANDMDLEFQKARVKLKLLMPDAPLPNVLGSDDKLRQVFRNIILNALQASSEGGLVEMRLSSAEGAILKKSDKGMEEIPRRELAVTISDHGSGIEPAILSKIFDPFFTSKDVGTGLGLSISQKIVDQHGGRIEVKSSPGQGSSFTVFLPAV